MQKKILNRLLCLNCKNTRWNVRVDSENALEVREGTLECLACKKSFQISNGILNMLGDLPAEVEHEKEHSESMGYIVDKNGEKFLINPDTIRAHKEIFLKLPTGDGSHYFQPGGSFDNQAGNAPRFFKTLDFLKLKGNERVLEVGASFGWASRHLAQRGCNVIALDITNYLAAADLYFQQDQKYFDRIQSDMSNLPFKEASFDLIFSHSVIHHCKDLKKLFQEFHRVLSPGGRVVALHECAFGVFEDKAGQALQEAIAEGFNENAYTIPQWTKGAKQGGFRNAKVHFFSFIDDYIDRKKMRKSPATMKLSAAQFIQKHPWLNQALNSLSTIPRILFRPKAWMIITTKSSLH